MTKQELTECIDRYGRDLYAFCRHLTGSIQEADELYQDTWLKTVELSERIDAGGNVKSYCLSVALKLWNNRRRKYAWRRRIAGVREDLDRDGMGEIPDKGRGPEECLLAKDRDRQVRRAVCELPDRMKAVVLLFYMEGFSVAQTAEAAGISEGTVKSRLHQARKLLREKLEGVLNE